MTRKYKELDLKGVLERRKLEKSFSQERSANEESIKEYENCLTRITEAHKAQVGQLVAKIERAKDDLKQHKLAIEIAQQVEATWRKAFGRMLLISHGVIDELPEKLRDAEVELPLYGIPQGIRDFVLYYRGMLTRYKEVVKDAKKRL
jgi:hypothetical protein